MRGNLALAIFNLGMVHRAVLPAADRLTTADRRQPTVVLSVAAVGRQWFTAKFMR